MTAIIELILRTIADLIKGRTADPLQVLGVVAQLLSEVARGSLLVDDVHERAHALLRQAGILEGSGSSVKRHQESVPIRQAWPLGVAILLHVGLLMFILLGGCAPQATGAIDALTGDEATLTLTPGVGIVFDPGPTRAAEDVRVSILGSTLTRLPDECEPRGEAGARCVLGDVTARVVLDVGGTNVTATALYWRADEAIPRLEPGRVVPADEKPFPTSDAS